MQKELKLHLKCIIEFFFSIQSTVLVCCDHIETIDSVAHNEFIVEIPVSSHVKCHVRYDHNVLE